MERCMTRWISCHAPRAFCNLNLELRREVTLPLICHRPCHFQSRYTRPDESRSPRRLFSTRARRPAQSQSSSPSSQSESLRENSYAQPVAQLSQKITEEERDHFRRVERESKERQRQSPWTRQGSQVAPVARDQDTSASSSTGKLLTTPSRMLKLIIPLTPPDLGEKGTEIEPLALLVHPQQPLSYLERLIQSELPTLKENGKAPVVTFRAEDSSSQHAPGDEQSAAKDVSERDEYDIEDAEETMVDGHVSRTGKIGGGSGHREKVDSSSDPGDESESSRSSKTDPSHPNFVRWSSSTEIGDFIRDASRGKDFAIDIEGASRPIYVTVPSFPDRTYYLRTRLRKTARQISRMADIKRECDALAHRGAKRMAQVGFGGLIGWWAVVYWLTFRTSLGWDVMEPVTYLVGLSGLIGGYMWFLYHNREVSYKSAMHVTVSRRQSQLYERKGFNVTQWEGLIEEGNRLRREIKMIADEYDVEWDESKDEGDEKVKEALRKGRKKNDEKEKKSKDDGDEDDD